VSGKVTLRVIRGPMPGSALVFEEHDTIVFGRAKDCRGRLPGDDTAVSRHHFLLEVSPPQARLRDLGSRHGTWVNGTKCGGRRAGERAEDVASRAYPQVDLADGDEIRAGRTTFAVEVAGEPARAVALAGCSRCGAPATPGDGTHEPLCAGCASQSARAGAGGGISDDSIRTILPGFEVVRRLGVGGMGAVYLAKRDRDAVWVALKLMLAKVAVNESARLRFARESSIVEQLSHPNIVAFYERGSEGASFFFTMEFCPGGSLAELLKRRDGKLPFDEAAAIALQALDALAYAHEREVSVELPDGRSLRTRGVVHRDIKPMNILLTGADHHWTAKLSDFGLAKCFQTAGLSGCTVTGDAAGALPYMPREQLLDFKNVLPVSDVWSMGATFYEMLTGETPRDMPQGRDPLEIILGGRTVPIRERDAAVPAAVATVVDRALSEEPASRFVNAREFRDALVAALSACDEAKTQAMPSMSSKTQIGAEAAFVVLDLAWREAARAGETWTAGRVLQLRTALEGHPLARTMLHIRSSGDGAMVVTADVQSAIDVARTFRLPFGDQDLPLRRAVHWGAVRIGAGGEPLGPEVQRAMLLRHCGENDRDAGAADSANPMPRAERVVITRAALERLSAAMRREFTPLGKFRLPGFEEADELWSL
jgi:serine/threonine protein kinase